MRLPSCPLAILITIRNLPTSLTTLHLPPVPAGITTHHFQLRTMLSIHRTENCPHVLHRVHGPASSCSCAFGFSAHTTDHDADTWRRHVQRRQWNLHDVNASRSTFLARNALQGLLTLFGVQPAYVPQFIPYSALHRLVVCVVGIGAESSRQRMSMNQVPSSTGKDECESDIPHLRARRTRWLLI